METEHPYKTKLSTLPDKQFESLATRYYEGNKKIDKNILINTREKLLNLKTKDNELYEEIVNENNDTTRINNRISNIKEYFLDKEKFKLFQEKVSNTATKTIKAKKDLTQRDKDNIRISESRLKDVKNDEAELYWNYMNRPYIKNTNIEKQIIGTLDSDKITAYINNSLEDIGGSYMNGEIPTGKSSDEEFDEEFDEESTSFDSNTNVIKNTQDNTSNNKYMNYDIEEITDIVKNMPADYDKKLLEKQDELNNQCHTEISQLRSQLSRLGWGQKLLDSEKQNQNQNQNQSTEYLVTLDSISDKSARGKMFYPVTPMPSRKKPPLPTSPPPDKRLKNIGGDTTTDVQNTKKTRPPIPTSLPKINNNAPTSAQTNFLNILQWRNEQSFEDIKNKIIDSYNKLLVEAHNKLLAEFRREQIDAFSALSKKRSYKNSVEKSKQNINNVKDSLYNFDVSVERFLQELEKLIPPPPPKKPNLSPRKPPPPSKKPNLSNTKNKIENKSPLDNSQFLDNEDPVEEDDNENSKSPENIIDIIDGKLYQSNFLEAVANSLLPLYGYMDNENATENNTEQSDEEDDENTADQLYEDNGSTDTEKGKGLLSRIKGIFSKKEDSNNNSFKKDDMKDIISSLYSTKDSNMYNLRLLHQQEAMNNYSDKYGMDKPKVSKLYFSGEYGKGIYDSDKKNATGSTEIKNLLERFQYTRAILRAYICIKNDVTDVTSNNGATQANNKNLTEGIYTDFLSAVSKIAKNDNTAGKEICEKYLNQCQKCCESKDDKHNYENLISCLKKVKQGNKYYDSDLKAALRKNNIDANKEIVKNIRLQDKWLISQEGTTELNLQLKEIDKNIKNK